MVKTPYNGDPTDDPTVTIFEQNNTLSVIKSQTDEVGGLGDALTYDLSLIHI